MAFGPSGESRTHGLLNPIQARYQTALHPDVFLVFRTSDDSYYSAPFIESQQIFYGFTVFIKLFMIFNLLLGNL